MRHTPADLSEVFQRLGLSREFQPLAWIGEGGSAQVYRTRHLVTGKEVALKVWDRLSPLERGRFLREVEVMRHATDGRRDVETCIVDVLWAGETQSAVYPVAWVAMSLYECSLADRLTVPPPLAEDEMVRICDDLLAGLSNLHGAGILHRDVKPANVLLRGGRAVITDFGLAARSPDEITSLNAGTPGYLAPELDGPAPAAPSVRSDLYAAGMTIRAMTRHHGAGLPRMEAVIAKAVDPDPGRRYATAEEMRRAFDVAARTVDGSAARGDAWLRQLGVLPAGLRARVSLPMVAALLAAVALGVSLTLPLGEQDFATLGMASGESTGRDTVRDKECFTGEITLKAGQGLMLAQRNVNAVNDAWGIEVVWDLPPAGAPGPWSVTQYFGKGNAAVGQQYELRLAKVPAQKVHRGMAPDEKDAVFAESTRVASGTYRRASGAGEECPD